MDRKQIMSLTLRSLAREPVSIAVLVSLLLSTLNVINDDTINSDGILYIESARLFLEQGWQASYAHYPWPFYQILIAVFSKITFLDLEHAAYVLNAGFLAGLAYAFVRCSEYLFRDQKIAWAAVVILLTHLNINGYRDLIIRDFGYWCFFFVGFLMLLKFYTFKKQRYLVFFTMSMLLATAFRIEGIIFLFLGPLILFFNKGSWSMSVRNIFVCWSPLFIIAVIGGIYYLFYGDNTVLGRITSPLVMVGVILDNLVNGIREKGQLLEENVIGVYARNLGTQSFIAILIMMFVTKLFSATGFIPSLLAMRTLAVKRLRKKIMHSHVLYWFTGINIVVLVGFLLAEYFLSGRYVITLVLLFCLLASVALADIFESVTPSKKLKTLRIAIVVALVYLLLDGVTSFAPGKMYRRDAANWLEQHYSIEQRLLSNDELMFYYSGRSVPRDMIAKLYEKTRFSQIPDVNLNDYDIVAIQIGRKQPEYKQRVIDWVGKQPDYQTENSKGAAVLIFKIDK